jgi:hypothetical protein
MSSIPQDVTIPKSSGQFVKLQEGKTRVRVLSNAVVGWEGWKNNKPFRHEGNVCKIKPEQVDLNQNGNPNINYFWAFVVWNYTEKKLQIWEITQKTIMTVLKDFEDSNDWGDLKLYDIEVSKTKVGDKTTYTTIGIPPKPVSEEIKNLYASTEIDLSKMFSGDYPITETVDTNDVPFD